MAESFDERERLPSINSVGQAPACLPGATSESKQQGNRLHRRVASIPGTPGIEVRQHKSRQLDVRSTWLSAQLAILCLLRFVVTKARRPSCPASWLHDREGL